MTLTQTIERTPKGGQHPHNWSVPSKRPRFSKTFPEVPDRRIFRDALISYPLKTGEEYLPTLQQYPTAGHVAVHLCLLECFSLMKDEVESTCTIGKAEISLNIEEEDNSDDCLPSYIETESRLFANSLEPCWLAFVERASVRYERWFERLEKIIRHAAAYNRYGTGSHTHGAFTEHYLPPLDVLFIWYLRMLRPDTYLESCRLNGFKKALDICFPWDALSKAIDLDSMQYKLSHAAKALFKNFTGLTTDWKDNLQAETVNVNSKTQLALVQFMDVQDTIFMEQMHDLLWIRSPSIGGTIDRSSSSYGTLLTKSCTPFQTLSLQFLTNPSLGLSWRTHKLYPVAYLRMREQRDIAISSIGISEHDTKQTVEKSTSGDGTMAKDAECYCWTCERLRDADIDTQAPLLRQRSPASIAATLSSKDVRTVKSDLAVYRQAELARQATIVGALPPSYRNVKAKKLRERFSVAGVAARSSGNE